MFLSNLLRCNSRVTEMIYRIIAKTIPSVLRGVRAHAWVCITLRSSHWRSPGPHPQGRLVFPSEFFLLPLMFKSMFKASQPKILFCPKASLTLTEAPRRLGELLWLLWGTVGT